MTEKIDMMTTLLTRLVMRRAIFRAAVCGVAAAAGGALSAGTGAAASEVPADEEAELVRRLVGGSAVISPLVRLDMPAVFGNGYSVPLSLAVDSPMTEADHVRQVHMLAPKNPIGLVARFGFTPQSGRAAVTTRIRLAEPQTVLAVAEMNDGALLMARTWVKVDSDGCN